MGFDLKVFEKTQFNRRIGDVEVPELAAFFGKDDNPVWKVRNLTAPEMATVEMASRNVEKLKAIIEGVTSDQADDLSSAVKDIIGVGGGMEPEFSKQLTKIRIASVEPEISQQIAVKLANVSPNAFYRIISKINELSGQGAEMGKLQASTKTKKLKDS